MIIGVGMMSDLRQERYNTITGSEAEEKIVSMLRGSELGRLALFDEKYPYIIPMNHVYYEGNLILHGSFEGKKIDLMEKNASASYEIDYVVNESNLPIKKVKTCHLEYESVILFGEVRQVENSKERYKYLSIMVKEYGMPFQHGSEERCNAMLFKIHSASARTGRFLPRALEHKLFLCKF